MTDLRKKFTENAEQFDSLMVEMLEENEALKQRAKNLEEALVYAAFESHATPAYMLPENVILRDGNTVIATLNSGLVVMATDNY